MRNERPISCVIVAAATPDKQGLKDFATQMVQMTTACIQSNLQIVSTIVVIRGGTKEILKELERLEKKQIIECVAIYSPSQIAKDLEDYQAFKSTIQEHYKAPIVVFRTPY